MGCTFELKVVIYLVQSLVSDVKSLLCVLQVVAHAITVGSFLPQLRLQLLDTGLQWGIVLQGCEPSVCFVSFQVDYPLQLIQVVKQLLPFVVGILELLFKLLPEICKKPFIHGIYQRHTYSFFSRTAWVSARFSALD